MTRDPMPNVYARLWLEATHAQLVCTTHDGSVLCKCLLARRLRALPVLTDAERRRYRAEKRFSVKGMAGVWWRPR